jgi:hypothetical protein
MCRPAVFASVVALDREGGATRGLTAVELDALERQELADDHDATDPLELGVRGRKQRLGRDYMCARALRAFQAAGRCAWEEARKIPNVAERERFSKHIATCFHLGIRIPDDAAETDLVSLATGEIIR